MNKKHFDYNNRILCDYYNNVEEEYRTKNPFLVTCEKCQDTKVYKDFFKTFTLGHMGKDTKIHLLSTKQHQETACNGSFKNPKRTAEPFNVTCNICKKTSDYKKIAGLMGFSLELVEKTIKSKPTKRKKAIVTTTVEIEV